MRRNVPGADGVFMARLAESRIIHGRSVFYLSLLYMVNHILTEAQHFLQDYMFAQHPHEGDIGVLRCNRIKAFVHSDQSHGRALCG